MKQNIEFTSNTIPQIHSQAAENGVLRGIGMRQGLWKVSLKEPANESSWYINIEGPNGGPWGFKFEGNDQSEGNIALTVDRELP